MHAKEKLSREFSTNKEHLYSGSEMDTGCSYYSCFSCTMHNELLWTVKPK